MKAPATARSDIMRAVKSKDTRPELILRRALFARGFRYRLHATRMPGKPDLVFPKYRAAVFVHGCFWHGHDCPRGARVPKTNTAYWLDKIARNKTRDAKNVELLRAAGWRVRIVWECELRDAATIARCADWIARGGAKTSAR